VTCKLESKHREIFAVLNFTKETVLKYGNPVGLSPEELTLWSNGLDLKNRMPTIFYTGMYSYMGYAETALILEYVIKKEGLMLSDLLNLAGKARLLGYKSTMKDLLRLLRSPMGKLSSIFGISSEKLSRLRTIAEETDSRNQVYWNMLVKGAKLLQKGGVDFAYLGRDEPDSGVALHTFGMLDDFSDYARDVYKKLKGFGVKEIITMDPITAAVFKKFYPEFVDGFDIDVKHITEVLSLSGSAPTGKEVVFHDPCYLARHLKITEQPRKLLAEAGYKVIDPPNSRERTRCDGGGVEYTDPVIAIRTAQIRFNEVLSTGNSNIVTSCPACVMMFRAANYFSEKKANVYDITDMLLTGEAV
jgi:hypothetical protein